MAVGSQYMTTEEFLALPDDGVDRDLIRGELRLRDSGMTTRGRPHCQVTTKLAFLLYRWLATQPTPRGKVYTGEIRVRLTRNPDTFVGVDLAYVPAKTEEATGSLSSFIEGPDLLAIEIVSPSDTAEGIAGKVRGYLDAGVPLIWYVDPAVRTVVAFRQDGRHELFNEHQELTAEPQLPGFRVPVGDIFAD